MFPARLEFVPYKPDPIQISPHRKLVIFRLHPATACVPLRQSLVIERKRQNRITAHHPCMKSPFSVASIEASIMSCGT
jgi:hypothetical protein